MIHIIGDNKKRINYDPNLAEKINQKVEEEKRKEALEAKLKPKQDKQEKQEKDIIEPSNVSVKDISDFWRIEGVEYKNNIYTVDLAKKLFPSMTQDKLAEYSKKARAEGKFYGADMPLNYSIFRALYNQRTSKEAEEAKKIIEMQMIYSWLVTLTRINYKAKRLDEVIHNYNQDDEYKIDEKIVGPDGFVEKGDRNTLKALIGTDDIKEINDVFDWLVGKKAHIWRLNSKPERNVGGVATFGVSSGRAYLNCGRGPDEWDSALRIRIKE